MYLTNLTQVQRIASSFAKELCVSKCIFAFQNEEALLTKTATELPDHAEAQSVKAQIEGDFALDSASSKLIVTAEALNVEKLWQIQEAMAEHIQVHHWQIQNSRTSGCRIVARADISVIKAQGLNSAIEALALKHQLEIAVIDDAPTLTQPGLLVMDMDSTVIGIECIDEIAKLAGVGEQVSEVTELAMQGKLEFSQSLTQRVACLVNADEAILQTVRDALPLLPGIESLIAELKQNGWKIAIASGGFTYFADYLKERLGLDTAVSNTLEIVENKLTGTVIGSIVDAQVKAQTVESLAQQYGIPMQQTVAMGDGANDLVMMDKAALGVAYKAKPVVREKAQTAIRFAGLDQMLEYLR